MQKNQPLLRTGSVLVSLYGILAFAAIGRSSYELISKFYQAPIPYALSFFSALVYLSATLALARNTVQSTKVALFAVSIELIGVMAVGALSFLVPSLFTYAGKPVHTVWSFFGVGYGCVPLFLPMIGLFWLGRRKAKSS